MTEPRYDFRMLWSSNALWAPTGYGVQAKYVIPRLQRLGVTVAQYAWYGLQGASLNLDIGEGPVKIYPQGYDPYGNDMYGAYCDDFEADLLMTLLDIWVMPPHLRDQIDTPWMPWFPVDCSPPPEMVVERAKEADFPTTYSRFGQQQMADVGLHTYYIPHGVDCAVFEPKDRADARKRFGIEDEETFLIAMVGANKGFPSRKGYPEAAWAFKAFHERHPNSMLYIHCNEGEQLGGIDFGRMFRAIPDFPRDAVRFVDQAKYRIGLQDPYMVAVYNAADVLLQPSYNEGFGIPLIESQACGTPVVANDCTSMTELIGPGVAVEPLQPSYYPVGSWSMVPCIEGFVEGLEEVYRGDRESRRAASREFALQYDWDRVFEDHWIPVMDAVWDQISRAKNHDHQWMPTGIFDSAKVMHVPCAVKDCPAEMLIRPDGKRSTRSSGFELRIGGVDLDIEDDPKGGVAKTVCKEAKVDYDLPSIPVGPGDVVIDIGAQVGVISCYLAKAKGATVYAYEPVPANFERLKRNIRANGVEDLVHPFNLAVTGDGRQVEVWADVTDNSGCGSMYIKSGPNAYVANSVTLADIMLRIGREMGRKTIKLLKIDCEGSEYEILKAKPSLLDRVEWMIGEIHANADLNAKGWTPNNLLLGLRLKINPERLRMGVTSLG